MTDLAHRSSSDLPRFSGMLDAHDRVTGRINYAIDIALPKMIHAKLLRSTSPHARIVSIDTSRAKQVPGVLAVLTGADIAARSDINPWYGPVYRDQPILAIGKVRYVGEPVVAVAAIDTDVAQEALDLIDVVYDELTPVFDVDDAIAAGAPLVHEEPVRTGITFADLILSSDGGNVCNHFKLRKGDVEAGFAEADHVFEDVFTSPPVQHVPMETHACVADVRNGRITVHAGSQMPSTVRSQLAEIFKVPQSSVRVIVPTLGGGYGAKTYPKLEPITAMLSLVTRRPVRLHLTREEEFVTITKHGVKITMATGVKNDGTIVARRSTCLFNTGAYADIGPRLIKNGGFATGGPHRIPNVWADSYAIYTNIVPAGAFRGYGVSQAAWAYESQMDMIADKLGWDPYEFRMQNLLLEGDPVMTGQPMEDAHFQDLLRSAAQWIGWDPNEAPRREGTKVIAKGLSCIIKATVTPSTSTCAARLSDDGSLDVMTSTVEMGQGAKTALAIMASDRMSISVHSVHVSEPDTDVTPYDQGTASSRSTHAMGAALDGALDEIEAQLRALASDRLEVAPTDLELHAGRVRVKGSPDRALDYGDLIRGARRGNLMGSSIFASEGGLDPETGLGIGSVHWHQGVGAAEVAVDTETGRVEVRRFHAGVYAGRIINPVQAELQTEGNVAFGLGQALTEEMIFDGGQLQNGNLGDYMITSIEDMPKDLHVEVLESPDYHEIHGLGETTLPPVMPAIANAVARATGVRIHDLPITPEKILRGLRAREEGAAS